ALLGAGIEIISRMVDKVEELKNVLDTVGTAWVDWSEKALQSLDTVNDKILQLEDATNKLFGLPEKNDIAIAAGEATQAIDKLDSAILAASTDLIKMFETKGVGDWAAIFSQVIPGGSNQANTKGVEAELRPDVKKEIDTEIALKEAQAQLEIDSANKVAAARIAADNYAVMTAYY